MLYSHFTERFYYVREEFLIDRPDFLNGSHHMEIIAKNF